MTSSSSRSLMAYMGSLLFSLLLIVSSAYGQDAFFQTGTASWYGPWHHGKYTASGEVFDMFAMTAAHRTLPIGTLVEVKHKLSGKSVIVRINDRGPYVKNRIIDLSYAAADRLGMTGISQVSLSVVGSKDGKPLSGTQAFFVRLKTEKQVSDTVERQLSRLIRVGLYNAASLLHQQEGIMALGPYESFQDSQDALIRIATTHPEASIILAEKHTMIPALLAVAEK